MRENTLSRKLLSLVGAYESSSIDILCILRFPVYIVLRGTAYVLTEEPKCTAGKELDRYLPPAASCNNKFSVENFTEVINVLKTM